MFYVYDVTMWFGFIIIPPQAPTVRITIAFVVIVSLCFPIVRYIYVELYHEFQRH